MQEVRTSTLTKTNGANTMAKRQSIYVPDDIKAILDSFGENSVSGAIARLVERYDKITRDETPELSGPEWSAVCDILNGCGSLLSSGGHDHAPMAWASIMDAQQDGTGEKWGIDCVVLAQKVRCLSLAGRLAVWDVAARFWASPRLNDLATLDLLLESGAKVTPELTEPPEPLM